MDVDEISPLQLRELLEWMNEEEFLDHQCDSRELQTIMDNYMVWKRGW